MRALLRRGADGLLHFLVRHVAGKVIAFPIRRRLAQFEAATCGPREVQEALLRRILAAQAHTAFGRDHGFAAVRDVADFRRQVPVAGYEYVAPYIDRVRRGETSALLSDPRVYMFALTSGTTASRKYIPVTAQYLADYKRGWNLWGLRVFRDHRPVAMRPIVQMSGDWRESLAESGVPCGAVTGLTAHMQKRVVRWLYCVPESLGRIKDAAAKYYVALRLSLPRRPGMVIAANPSTLINLAKTGDQEKESLLRDLADGTLNPRLDLPADVRADVARRLDRHPERVRELEAIVARAGHLYPGDYWGPHCLLGNWTGGSMGAYLRHYPRYFAGMPVRDIGLIASEGRMTIPVADHTPAGVLDVTSHYFEFVPEEEMDSPNRTVLAAHELQEGKTYYILLTTAYGLYRYDIHDVVRVAGFYNGTPLLEFLTKGAHFANITGEKLSEHHVTQAMVRALRELDLAPSTYSLAPCWDDDQPYYGLFVERGDLLGDPDAARRLPERLDALLKEANIEYASKRDSLRLGAVRLEPLPPGAWREWDRERLQRTGGTLEQYKHPCLIADAGFHAQMKKRGERAAG